MIIPPPWAIAACLLSYTTGITLLWLAFYREEPDA